MERKNLIILILIVLMATIGLFFIFKKSPTITNFPSSGENIVAFGDSLVQGMGSTDGNDFVSILSRKIGEPIINLGVSGNTSADGLARINTVQAQDPKVVILLLGGNDFLRKIPTEETFKNIKQMVIELQQNGSVVVLIGIQGGLLGDPYEKYFEDIARTRGTLYVPSVLKGIIGKTNMMSDAIHPNNAGYEKMAEKILPVLQKALP